MDPIKESLKSSTATSSVASYKPIHCRSSSWSPSSLASLRSRASVEAEQAIHKLFEEANNAEKFVKKVINEAWNVCHFTALPEWMQDNDYLLKGHRPQLRSFKSCFMSIFRLHTETVNIWTHLLGCIGFITLAIYLFTADYHPLQLSDKFILSIFFAGAILCLGFSTAFHAVSCHSPEVGKIFSKLDYCGISFLITGSFLPWFYYAFYCCHISRWIYICVSSFLATCCIICSCWDQFSKPKYRPLRTLVFAAFGTFGAVPGFHGLFFNEKFPSIIKHDSMIQLLIMGACYLVGALLYALRIPERYFPGKCDYWFHSHQIFHVLVVAAAITHFNCLSNLAIYMATHEMQCL